MDRLDEQKAAGISWGTLCGCALFFLTLSVVGQGVFQNRLLKVGSISPEELLDTMRTSGSAMTYATLALILQAVGTCAVPIIAFLLVETVSNTKSFRSCFFLVAAVAVISELPYNLAVSGELYGIDSQNPLMGAAVSMVLLYAYKKYKGSTLNVVFTKLMVTVAAFVWVWILHSSDGVCMLLTVICLWCFRNLPLYRTYAGAAVVICCALLSPFYLAAPMGFLLIHFYKGEMPQSSNKVLACAGYPVMLLLVSFLSRIYPLSFS